MTLMSDFWREVVGIPIGRWVEAKTPQDIADLIRRREAGEFLPKPPPTCDLCLESLDLKTGVAYPICDLRTRECREYHLDRLGNS